MAQVTGQKVLNQLTIVAKFKGVASGQWYNKGLEISLPQPLEKLLPLTEAIVEYFVLRWNLEVTFEEARAHLGIETQRQWADRAIRRTTPILFGLFSLICLIGYRQNQQENDLLEGYSTAWYDKSDSATFNDVLTYVKRLIILGKSNFYKSACNDEFIKIRRQDLEILINNGLMAA